MSLDLEDVEGEDDDFTNANDGASSGVHDGLAGALSEGAVERLAVVLSEVVAHEWLATVLVHSLQDLVCCCVAETREEREEAGAHRGIGRVSEDDLVELGGRGDLNGATGYSQHSVLSVSFSFSHASCWRDNGHLGLVAHQSLGDGVNRVEDCELGDTSGTCTRLSVVLSLSTGTATAGIGCIVPAPRMRAEVDSFLKSFAADEPVGAGAAIIFVVVWKEPRDAFA